MLKALLLDLDGTLADTDALHMPLWADLLGSRGIEVDEEFYKHRISGRLNPDILDEFLPHVSEEETRRMIDAKEVEFRNRTVELEPLPGLIDFLEEGRNRGLSISLVTNAPRGNAEAVVRGLGIEKYFESTVLAEEVGAGKPDPEPYRAALRELGIRPEETIAFEDSVSGIISAVAADIRTVGITTTQTREKLQAAGAFLTVADFRADEIWELLDH